MALKAVSTKVEQHILDELERRAKELGKSRGAYIRDVLLDHLENDEQETSSSIDPQEVRRELRALRNSLMTSVAGLLTYLGDCSQQEAEDWVDDHLR